MKGRVYALTQEDAQEASEVSTGTLLINNIYAKVLFDPGATHTFISIKFADLLKSIGYLDCQMIVSTPTGEQVLVNHMIPKLEIYVGSRLLSGSAYILDISDFDVILGMD